MPAKSSTISLGDTELQHGEELILTEDSKQLGEQIAESKDGEEATEVPADPLPSGTKLTVKEHTHYPGGTTVEFTGDFGWVEIQKESLGNLLDDGVLEQSL